MSLPVHIQNLTKRYDKHAVLDNVSLSIAEGELFFLLGPSGCGKTTLLRSISGFAKPDEGRILFGDRDLTHVPPHRRNCGFVFQNYALWPHLTVFENVAFGLKVRKLAKEEIHTKVSKSLQLVRLEEYAMRKPTQLSGGQQQRVALARALVITPDVLLLDEPLSNLDAKLRLEMRDEIRRIHAETGITTIYVTHEQKEALSLAQRVAIMNLGKIEQIGSPRDLYCLPASPFVANFIGETNMFPGTITSSQKAMAAFGELALPESSVKSANVAISIRPEALRIHRKNPDLPNTFQATLNHTTYLGEVEQHSVQLGPHLDLKVLAYDPGETPLQPKEEIWLEFPVHALRVFAA